MLAGVPQASAHAFLNASVPSPDSTVSTPPKEVKLSYSEPVEIRFSIFKVYKLDSSPGADMRALHTAADALMAADLLKRGDEAARSDAGVANTTNTSTDITLRLKDLEPGAYVVMWRALSVDTHTTQGVVVFVYTPVGSRVVVNLTPGRGASILAPHANLLALADGGTQEAPSTNTEWGLIALPSDLLAAPLVQGSDPAGGRLPLRLQLPEFDAVAVSHLGLAGQPVLSLDRWPPVPDPSADIRAPMLGIGAAPPPVVQALQAAPSDPPSLPANIQVSGIVLYRFFDATVPPVAGDGNLNDLTPMPDPTLNDATLEVAVNWTLSPTFSVFADLAPEYNTEALWNATDIEQLYLDAHNLFGVPGFGIRVGRDRIKLGLDGLLLDETVFDGGRREGFEMRLSQLGPVSILGFTQYALDDGLQVGNWASSRRVWGARAEADVGPGWTVDVSYRADTAADVEVGPCPGMGCNVGNGFSGGVEGNLMPGMDLIVEAATYTQLGDVGRWYDEASLVLDLQQLLKIQSLQPVLTLWYKDFDPYTPPLDAPLGHLLTPDNFGLFNTNDNLIGGGARLDLAITPTLSVFGLAEGGTYKDGGPNYSVYSVGAKYALSANTLLLVTYNVYWVDGGVVTTSPVSGLQLSDNQMWKLDLQWSLLADDPRGSDRGRTHAGRCEGRALCRPRSVVGGGGVRPLDRAGCGEQGIVAATPRRVVGRSRPVGWGKRAGCDRHDLPLGRQF